MVALRHHALDIGTTAPQIAAQLIGDYLQGPHGAVEISIPLSDFSPEEQQQALQAARAQMAAEDSEVEEDAELVAEHARVDDLDDVMAGLLDEVAE